MRADFPVKFHLESPASLNLSGSVVGGEVRFTESTSVTTLLGTLWFFISLFMAVTTCPGTWWLSVCGVLMSDVTA